MGQFQVTQQDHKLISECLLEQHSFGIRAFLRYSGLLRKGHVCGTGQVSASLPRKKFAFCHKLRLHNRSHADGSGSAQV